MPQSIAMRNPQTGLELTTKGLSIIGGIVAIASVIFSMGGAWAVVRVTLDRKADKSELQAHRDSVYAQFGNINATSAANQKLLNEIKEQTNDVRCEVLKSKSRLVGCGR